MIGLLTFILALVCLYLLSQAFLQRLYEVLVKLTHSHKKAIYTIAFIFLPGTFVHEISHFMAALFLLVPVGELRLVPEIQDRGVNLGSVQIGKTDVLRHAIIGIAPFIVGTTIMLSLFWHGITTNALYEPLYVGITLYVIFQLSHTMFSSKRDLRAVIELGILIIVIVSLLLIFNITEPFELAGRTIEEQRTLIERVSLYLFIPIGLEALLLVLFKRIR
jgi:hypothetical protein